MHPATLARSCSLVQRYKNPDGKVYTLSPCTIDEYWEMACQVDRADYLIE